MKKIMVVLTLLAVALAYITVSSQSNPIKGQVVSFNDIAGGGTGEVNKEQAKKLADEGNPIVFKVGSGSTAKIYFVFNQDGTFGSKNLAKYANNKFVGIVGKTKRVKGINIIIAEMIESMD